MRVKITAESGHSSGVLVTGEDGSAIDGLTEVVWRAEANDICRAELYLAIVDLSVEAEAKAYFRGKEVVRVEYADGSFDEFEPPNSQQPVSA